MKLRHIFFILLVGFLSVNAFAQDAEYDDMYFNSKDRAKVAIARGEVRKVEEKAKAKQRAAEDVNPTDSYSARNVNPEFTARSNSESAQADNEDYFVNNYQFQKQSQFNNFNRGYNNWYNDPWYSSAYFGSGINRWNSPYYGSYYSPYNNPWNDPYYQSGWSSSFSYYYGNNWNYGWSNGWGMNYGYGCPNYWSSSWYSPYYSSWYSPYSNWYSPYGYGYGYGYGYPSTVVVVEDGRGPVYGKRGTRGGYQNTTELKKAYSNTGSGSRSDAGRTRTTRQQPYYENSNSSWQNESRQSNNSWGSNNGRISSQSTTRTSPSHDSNNNGWRPSSNSSNNHSSYSPSRSSSSGGSSGSHSSRGRGGH